MFEIISAKSRGSRNICSINPLKNKSFTNISSMSSLLNFVRITPIECRVKSLIKIWFNGIVSRNWETIADLS